MSREAASGDPSLSIITLTHDNFSSRGSTLPILFDALERQSLPTDTELVVVDDGSTDRTPAFIRQKAERIDDFDIRLVRKPHTGNQCENRNLGIEKARGDLLFLLDDDTIPLQDDAIQQAISLWEPGNFLCGARRYWSPPAWDGDEVSERLAAGETEQLKAWAHLPREAIKRRTGSRSLQEYTFIENFGVVAREDVVRVGKLDEEYEEWGHGDTDLMLRLLLDGVGFINVHDTLDVLHLNGPLGFPRGASETNSDIYHRKLDAYGVDFDVTRLYEAPTGTHDDVVMPTDGGDASAPHTPGTEVKITRSGGHRLRTVIPDHVGAGDGTEDWAVDRDLSVIIPTYDAFRLRKGAIELVLTALENQIGVSFEVVIVDDGSTDRTSPFLEQFADRVEFDLAVVNLDRHTGNRSLARNEGVRRATNDLLLFLDDDTIPLSSDALRNAVTHYEPGHFVCGARTFWTSAYDDPEDIAGAVRTESYEQLARESVLPRGIRRREGYRSLRGYSFLGRFGLVSRSDFDAVGGFDATAMDGWGKEDEDLMARLCQNGVRCRSLFDAVSVLHMNHPITDEEFEYQERLVERYREREEKADTRFNIHELLGVQSDEGSEIVQPLDES